MLAHNGVVAVRAKSVTLEIASDRLPVKHCRLIHPSIGQAVGDDDLLAGVSGREVLQATSP
jgi:hypothetical protein